MLTGRSNLGYFPREKMRLRIEHRPPISLSEACGMIKEHTGFEYEPARSNLLKIKRNFRYELTKQGEIDLLNN